MICDDRAFGRLRRMKLRCVDMDARRVKSLRHCVGVHRMESPRHCVGAHRMESPRHCVGAHRLKGHAQGEITVALRKGTHRMASPRHCVGVHRLKPLRHCVGVHRLKSLRRAWTAVASTQHLTCCQPQKGAYFAEAGL